jgi:hypothetical protein
MKNIYLTIFQAPACKKGDEITIGWFVSSTDFPYINSLVGDSPLEALERFCIELRKSQGRKSL